VGLRAGLDTVERRKNSSPCRQSNPGRPSRSLEDICKGFGRKLLCKLLVGTGKLTNQLNVIDGACVH